MHPEDIKAAMRKNGVKASDLARHLGVSQMSVSNTVRGHIKSRRIADAVAKIVGRTVDEIWPGSYSASSGTERVAQLLQARSPVKARRSA